MSNEHFAGWKQRLAQEDNMFDGYVKHPVNNIEFDAYYRRKEDSSFHPKFTHQHQQFYNDQQQKDNRRTSWQFTKRQRNYFDQYISQPSRYDPFFRRKSNSYLNPNEDFRSTQFDYYYQRKDDPRRWGRKKPPTSKKKHFDEYLQPQLYSIDSRLTAVSDNNFPSAVSLDEKRISHVDYFQGKNKDVSRYKKEHQGNIGLQD